MKVYHVETKEAYDELMIELEEKGCKWRGGEKLTDSDKFSTHGKDTYVYEECCEIYISSRYYFKKQHIDVPVIEYKAKGEKMSQEKIKQELEEILDKIELEKILDDVSVAVCRGLRDTLTVESSLQKAKSSAKKLIEKIDKYLKFKEPEFKSGDIVASRIFRDASFSLVDGFWHIKDDCAIGDMSLEVFKEDTKIATPEEITEYKVALNFHNHGREPFEVKEGDLIEYPNGQNIMIYYPEFFSKADFLNDGFKLIKTAEEVNEWIRGE